MSWLTVIGNLLQLGVMVLTEVYAEKKAAREAGEAQALTEEKYQAILALCLERLRTKSTQESSAAQCVEDQVDAAKKAADAKTP